MDDSEDESDTTMCGSDGGFAWLICVNFGNVHYSLFHIVLIVPRDMDKSTFIQDKHTKTSILYPFHGSSNLETMETQNSNLNR